MGAQDVTFYCYASYELTFGRHDRRSAEEGKSGTKAKKLVRSLYESDPWVSHYPYMDTVVTYLPTTMPFISVKAFDRDGLWVVVVSTNPFYAINQQQMYAFIKHSRRILDDLVRDTTLAPKPFQAAMNVRFETGQVPHSTNI